MASILNPIRHKKAPLHRGEWEQAKGSENDRDVKRGFSEVPAYQAVEKTNKAKIAYMDLPSNPLE
jgi:hypothetical protein